MTTTTTTAHITIVTIITTNKAKYIKGEIALILSCGVMLLFINNNDNEDDKKYHRYIKSYLNDSGEY